MVRPDHNKTDEEIQELIAASDTPTERAVLLVLLSINHSLQNTAELSRELQKELVEQRVIIENHVEAVTAIKGGWKVATALGSLVSTVVVALALYSASIHVETLRGVKAVVEAHETRITRLEANGDRHAQSPALR